MTQKTTLEGTSFHLELWTRTAISVEFALMNTESRDDWEYFKCFPQSTFVPLTAKTSSAGLSNKQSDRHTFLKIEKNN